MSYVADQLAAKLRDAGPGARFNILSAVLPVLTHVRAFASLPASPITNSILGIPLLTVLDEFEEHAVRRTPVLTSWQGQAASRGEDVFGAMRLNPLSGPPLSPANIITSTSVAVFEEAWFDLTQTRQGRSPVGLNGVGPYSRYSRDGLLIACGYRRTGLPPFVVGTEPLGDTQNQTIGGFFEDLYPQSQWAMQVPRLSVIAADGSHTCGPQGTGFIQASLQSVPTGSATQRIWSAYSLSGFGSAATHTGLVKVQNIASPSATGPTLGDISAVGPLAGTGDKVVCFGNRRSIIGVGLSSGVWAGQMWRDGSPLSLTLDEIGGFFYGRRALSAADMQKLYYSPSASVSVILRPYQDPLRAMGYLDQMSHRQIAKLLDGIAAGTIDPQTATPSQVWDAVR